MGGGGGSGLGHMPQPLGLERLHRQIRDLKMLSFFFFKLEINAKTVLIKKAM